MFVIAYFALTNIALSTHNQNEENDIYYHVYSTENPSYSYNDFIKDLPFDSFYGVEKKDKIKLFVYDPWEIKSKEIPICLEDGYEISCVTIQTNHEEIFQNLNKMYESFSTHKQNQNHIEYSDVLLNSVTSEYPIPQKGAVIIDLKDGEEPQVCISTTKIRECTGIFACLLMQI